MTSCNISVGIACSDMLALSPTPGGGSGKLSVPGIDAIQSGGIAGGMAPSGLTDVGTTLLDWENGAAWNMVGVCVSPNSLAGILKAVHTVCSSCSRTRPEDNSQCK